MKQTKDTIICQTDREEKETNTWHSKEKEEVKVGMGADDMMLPMEQPGGKCHHCPPSHLQTMRTITTATCSSIPYPILRHPNWSAFPSPHTSKQAALTVLATP